MSVLISDFAGSREPDYPILVKKPFKIQRAVTYVYAYPSPPFLISFTHLLHLPCYRICPLKQ
jgi:hypothetical protein